ncbi:glutamine synthetase/guanido kinase [Hortaea werneckii]|nr:glutamine synthetase/guanido kinase [Hortaea werneckii]KAI7593378.1 glutamine synthetase/guanido kinase [Hortaea werneckii]
MAITEDPTQLTHADLPELLKNDISVKVGGTDIDGQVRGKLMSKKKFLSIAQSGFGFCSVVFGWDMHDQTYFKELKISNAENGYRDILAEVDLSSFRRIPWEKNVPFFLCSFREPEGQSLSACPRSLLERQCDKLAANGMGALAGAEYEFYTFRAPQAHHDHASHGDRNSSATAQFLQEKPVNDLPSLEQGMFGYSLTRPTHNQDWYYKIFESCANFRCDIEGWHTESGPGVYEAALEYGGIQAMADKAVLFKLAVKNISSKYGITPCFMAKPRQGLPGNSGHVHVSLSDPQTGANLLARDSPDPSPQYEDIRHLSTTGRHFLAGILDGLADVMPIVAPTVNSYKRLVENFWAPVTVSWGLEHRAASIRVIAPPTASPKGTRFEVRVAGADANPYLVFAAILALGLRGIEKKLPLPIAPLARGQDVGGSEDKGARLAKSLKEATERFARRESVAREVFGDEFVEHFSGTREHEVRLWEEAVTDWEVRRNFIEAFKNDMSEAAHQPSTTAPEANSTPLEPQNQVPKGTSQENLSSILGSEAVSEFDFSDDTLRPSGEIQEQEGSGINGHVKTGPLPVADCSLPGPSRSEPQRPAEDIHAGGELDASSPDDGESFKNESEAERTFVGIQEPSLHRTVLEIQMDSVSADQSIEDGRSTPPRNSNTETLQETPSRTLLDEYEKHKRRLFDAGKMGLFYTLTGRSDRKKPKTAVLNLAALQRMNIHGLQEDLADCAATSFENGRLSQFDQDSETRQRLLNLYCDAVRNLDLMREKEKLGYDRDPFIVKSSRALERDILKNSGLIPRHLLPQGELPPPYDHKRPLLSNGSGGRHHANEQTTKKQRLERFAMASFGGLLIIVPMLIMANVPGKIASLVTSCVAIVIFAALVTLGTKLGPHEVLASVAAYAAVLVVFVGLSLEKR